MKFLDKVKDLFSDEEEVVETEEIEVEEKEEHKIPTFMRNKIEEEQKREEAKKQREDILPKTNVISDREIVKTRTSNNFAFPIDIDDSDLVPELRYSKQNVLERERKKEKEKPVSELYAKKEEPKPKRFRPTPVISPVYGVLDKNYTKDEVKVQDESSYEIQRPSRKVDFETVRNKAFGNLTDDIKNVMCENCELYQEVKITKNVGKKQEVDNSNLLASMTEDYKEEDVSLGDAEDNYFDFGVSYEPPKKEEIEKETGVKIINHNEEESKAEKIEVKEEVKPRKTIAKEAELNEKDFLEDTKEFESLAHDEEDINTILNNNEDIENIDESNDIFNLIDSMYDEEEDKK